MAVLLVLVTACASAPQPGYVRVIDVIDGDSLRIRGDQGRNAEVRLHGIDAPEWGQPHNRAATRALSAMVSGEDVRLRVIDHDRYNRNVAMVYLSDGTNVNVQMVEGGHAWWYRRYAASYQGLEAAQRRAKSEGRGLWAGDDPVPPWNWRRGKR